ncbi:MAG: peptidoglycan recognition family protein [Anaerolineae bacterium]
MMLFSFLLMGCSTQSDLNQPVSFSNPPEIISRAEWGAAEPNIQGSPEGGYDAIRNPAGWFEYDTPLPEVLNTIVVHHSALPLSDGPLEIQLLHQENKGYADVGYHYLIDENGTIYEGRPINVRGAHTGGFNTGAIGIVLLGNFEEIEPTDAQLNSLMELNQFLKRSYQVTHLAGHNDFQPGETLCPGKNLEPLLPGLAKELEFEFGTAGYVGPSSQ